ncbi:MAG TPA: response regulator [Gemmatimonadales bacterium]|nr:response regulator [Gemmatimonadales bacterium]
MSSTRAKKYWGTQRVARICQVSPTTVANWIDQGHLKGHKTPTGRRRVVVDDLAAFLRAHGMPVPPELLGAPVSQPVVVLVEDDERYRQALRTLISRTAVQVELIEARNGVDGLLEIGRSDPDLIVLDYGLPDLNAEQVVERLLDPERKLAAEVIVITGGIDQEAQDRLRHAGVREIVGKASGMGAVIEAIRQALARQMAA